jgi:hypothetical protein
MTRWERTLILEAADKSIRHVGERDVKGPVKPQQAIDQRNLDIQAIALDGHLSAHEPGVP